MLYPEPQSSARLTWLLTFCSGNQRFIFDPGLSQAGALRFWIRIQAKDNGTFEIVGFAVPSSFDCWLWLVPLSLPLSYRVNLADKYAVKEKEGLHSGVS